MTLPAAVVVAVVMVAATRSILVSVTRRGRTWPAVVQGFAGALSYVGLALELAGLAFGIGLLIVGAGALIVASVAARALAQHGG